MITAATVALFVSMMLGHFVGDYLFQNQWMALTKSKPGRYGDLACTVHVLLYTVAIGIFSGVWSFWFLAAVFIPHWVIDRWSLANVLLKWKNGYQMMDTWRQAGSILEMQVWSVAFAAPVYIANDNTMHFVFLAGTAWLWMYLKSGG